MICVDAARRCYPQRVLEFLLVAGKKTLDGAFRVGDWRVEPQLNTIADSNRTTHLEPKVMKVLVYLAEHADQVIGKERLIQAVWPDTFVTDDVLTHAVSELRRAFGDDARAPRYIQTIPKGGYRLIGSLTLARARPEAARISISTPIAIGSERPTVEPVSPGSGRPDARRRGLPRTRLLGWGLALMLGAGAASWLWSRATQPTPKRVMRLSMNIQSTGPPVPRSPELPAFRISPDGTRLVYAANPDGRTRLYLRAIDELDARPIPGSEDGANPFFSPDGEWLGFWAQRKLKKVPLASGAAVDLCGAPTLRGATWTSSDTIVFAPTYDGALWQVPAGGGVPKQLTTLDRANGENSHRWPEALPDTKTVLFTIRRSGTFDNAYVAAVDLKTGERRVLFEGGSFAQYVPTGHLVYGRETALLAVPFDPVRLQVTGAPSRVLEGVTTSADTGAADFSVSSTGSLAYLPRGVSATDRTLVWVDEHGRAQPILESRRGYEAPRLSPDGRRLALTIMDGSDFSVWVYDLARSTLSRLTRETPNGLAFWHPDGQHLTFTSGTASAGRNVFWQLADTSQAPEQLTESPYWQWPTSWSSDGRLLAYTESDPTSGGDVWILERESGKRRPFIATSARESGPMFLPTVAGWHTCPTSPERRRCTCFHTRTPARSGKYPQAVATSRCGIRQEARYSTGAETG